MQLTIREARPDEIEALIPILRQAISAACRAGCARILALRDSFDIQELHWAR